MTNKSEFPDDKTKNERTKDLNATEIKQLELAGGVEGGMQAGSAGGPGEKEAIARSEGSSQEPGEGSEKPAQAPKP